jgi:hypothetical protein
MRTIARPDYMAFEQTSGDPTTTQVVAGKGFDPALMAFLLTSPPAVEYVHVVVAGELTSIAQVREAAR